MCFPLFRVQLYKIIKVTLKIDNQIRFEVIFLSK